MKLHSEEIHCYWHRLCSACSPFPSLGSLVVCRHPENSCDGYLISKVLQECGDGPFENWLCCRALLYERLSLFMTSGFLCHQGSELVALEWGCLWSRFCCHVLPSTLPYTALGPWRIPINKGLSLKKKKKLLMTSWHENCTTFSLTSLVSSAVIQWQQMY